MATTNANAPSRATQGRVRRGSLVALGLALGCLSLLCLLPGVTLGYWDRDEAEYAGVSHEMAQSGDFLVPRLFGKLYPDKPPLSEWMSAVSWRLLEENELTGRLPHVLLSSGSCVLVFLLGGAAFGWRKGMAAGALLATSMLFLVYGRLFTTDAALLFFTVLTVLCAHRVLQGRGGFLAVLIGGIALGLALLDKGPIGYMAPTLFVGGYWAARRRFHPPELGRVAALYVLSGIVGLPWFIAAAIATKGESLGTFLERENWYRYLHPMEGHGGPVFYFLLILIVGLFPWTGSLLLSRKAVRPFDPMRWGLLAWGGGSLLFFSFSATKLPHYLLPAMPAFVLLVAEADWNRAPAGRALAWGMALTGSLLFLGVVLVACRWELPGVAGGLIWLFAAVAAVSLAAPLVVARGPAQPLVLGLGVIASLLLAVFVPGTLDGARCLPRLGRAARLLRNTNEPVGLLKLEEPALAYYAGCQPATYWNSPDEVVRAAALSPTRSVLVWLESASGPILARDRRTRLQILDVGLSLIDPDAQGKLELCRVTAR